MFDYVILEKYEETVLVSVGILKVNECYIVSKVFLYLFLYEIKTIMSLSMEKDTERQTTGLLLLTSR